MKEFSDEKKNILHCLSIINDDVIDLPNAPLKIKVDLIIGQLYEVMRQLSDLAEVDRKI